MPYSLRSKITGLVYKGMLSKEEGARIRDALVISNNDDYIKELEHKVFNLEQKEGVLWRWCLINSVLLTVFTLLFAFR